MKYKVQPGDTLSELAVRFNTTTESLASVNNIKNPHLIYAGDTLIVPGIDPKWSLTEAIRKFLWG